MSVIAPDASLIALLIILTLGLLVPEVFRRFHFPFITLVILAGAVMGPNALGLVESNEVVAFFGFLGMTFLLLMAGLETKVSRVFKYRKKVIIMAFLNGFVPFLVGVSIGFFFGYSLVTSLLIGTIFISSAVAIIIPVLESTKLLEKDAGQIILASVLAVDIVSLVTFGIIFQGVSPIVNIPLPFFLLIMAASIGALFLFTPPISKFLMRSRAANETHHESQLRFVIVFAIGALVFFSWIGIHPILAAFLVGLALSMSLPKERSKIIDGKIHTLGYGLFIPVFLFVVGMEMDLKLLTKFDLTNVLMIAIVAGFIVAKISSGYVAGKIVKFSNKHAMSFGSASIIKLTTTLAVTYAASAAGLFDSALVTSMIILTIVTTFLGPVLVSFINRPRPVKPSKTKK